VVVRRKLLLPITLEVKSDNAQVKADREAAARRVIACLAPSLPESRTLCFLDDEDPSSLKRWLGATNRGISGAIHDNAEREHWPEYVWEFVFFHDRFSGLPARVIDDLVYLYGSAWTDVAGMTMTLAHELQHVVQRANARELWAVNSLVRHLSAVEDLKLEWADIPIERDARIVAKHISLDVCGERAVTAYIQKRMAEAVQPHDVADWQFVHDLTPADSVNLLQATQSLFQRLRPYRAELTRLMQENNDNPDFNGVDLHAFFGH
jgi:hypothetical protein